MERQLVENSSKGVDRASVAEALHRGLEALVPPPLLTLMT